MCFEAENLASEINEVVAHFELPLFIYDEIGVLTHSPICLCDQIPKAARNLREHILSKYDVCEDG